MPERKFYVCGQTVTVSAEYDLYNTIRLQFMKEAANAANEFGRKYDSYGNIDNLMSQGYDDGLAIIADVIVRGVIEGILMQLKIYDIDAKRFFEDFYQKEYYHWDEEFNNVQDQYMAIRLEQEQLDEYRTQRRLNRSRWVGGGFGIGGALKGAAKAGAMNMAEGALHGLFNAGAKVLSMADESRQKTALYESSSTRNSLILAIWGSVFHLHLAVWELFEKRSGRILHVDCIAEGAHRRAEAIRNNLAGMPKEEIRRIIPQVILLNPYRPELYSKLFSIFGDTDGGLRSIAEYFGLDTSVFSEAKEELADRIFSESIKQQLGKDEQAALNAKAQYELALRSNGAEDTQSARKNLREIENALNDFDLKARTITYRVNTRTFDTREETEKASREVSAINGLLQGLNYEEAESDAKKALQRLEGYTPEIQTVFDDYITKIKDLINSFNVEASTVKIGGRSIVLDREEAEKLKASPELNELASRWDEYKADRTDEALSYIADLIQKMPQKIRNEYWFLLRGFEKTQEKAISMAKVRISRETLLFMAVAVAGLVFIAQHWQGWNWFGLKGVAAAFMVILPGMASNSVPGGNSSSDENPNPSYLFFGALVWIYWEIAILIISLPLWETYSGLERVLIGAAFLIAILIIVANLHSLEGSKQKAEENARKAAGYISDFENLASQLEEYRALRETHAK